MKPKLTTLLCGFAVLMTSMGNASAGDNDEAYRQWQLKRIHQPSTKQLAAESRGKVFIYDGLTDRDIDQALIKQFNRVAAMMFTNTIVTNAQGTPMRDPETGEYLTEDDGCD